MRDSEKKVGRGDNNLDGERSVADDHPIDKPRPDVPTRPDEARGSDRGGGKRRLGRLREGQAARSLIA